MLFRETNPFLTDLALRATRRRRAFLFKFYTKGFCSVEFILSTPDQRVEPGFSVELKTSGQSRQGFFVCGHSRPDHGRVQQLFFLRMSATNKSAYPSRLYYPRQTHWYSYFALSFNKITKHFYFARPDYVLGIP